MQFIYFITHLHCLNNCLQFCGFFSGGMAKKGGPSKDKVCVMLLYYSAWIIRTVVEGYHICYYNVWKWSK